MQKFDPNIPLTSEQVRKKIVLPKSNKKTSQDILFQETAADAITKALNKSSSKENIVIAGNTGLGKDFITKVLGERYTANRPAPDDLITYLKFDEKIAGFLRTISGKGKELVDTHNKAIDDLVTLLTNPIRQAKIEEKVICKQEEINVKIKKLRKEFRDKYPLNIGLTDSKTSKVVLVVEDDMEDEYDQQRGSQQKIPKMYINITSPLETIMEQMTKTGAEYIAEEAMEKVTQSLLEVKSRYSAQVSKMARWNTLVAALKKESDVLEHVCKKKGIAEKIINTSTDYDRIKRVKHSLAKIEQKITESDTKVNALKQTLLKEQEFVVNVNNDLEKAYKEFYIAKTNFFTQTDVNALEMDAEYMDRRKKVMPNAVADAKDFAEKYYLMEKELAEFKRIEKENADTQDFDTIIQKLEAEYLNGPKAADIRQESKDKLKQFYEALRKDFKDKRKELVSRLNKKEPEDVSDILDRFKLCAKAVNRQKAKVIVDTKGTIMEGIGTVESDSLPHMNIRLGELFDADGGVYAQFISDLKQPNVLLDLINYAREGKIRLTNKIGTALTEEIALNTKLAIISSTHWGHLFKAHPELSDLFRNVVYLKQEVDYSEDNVCNLLALLGKEIKKNNYLPLDAEAQKEFVRLGLRMTADSGKISTQCNFYSAFLADANQHATAQNASKITGEHIRDTIESKIKGNAIKEWILESLQSGVSDCYVPKDPVPGSVNGLVVYHSNDIFASTGTVHRFNAKVAPGQGKSFYIEKDVGMAGPIYDMSTQKVNAWFSSEFGVLRFFADFWISAEQSYSGIDGDSASCVLELSRLSALSGRPVKPHFACTGSMNLMGEVNPIGGLNEKIEGAIDAFMAFDPELKANDYVMTVPISNVKDLTLREKYAEIIKKGNVKIYPVTRFDQVVGHAMDADYDTVKHECVDKLLQYKEGLEMISNHAQEQSDEEEEEITLQEPDHCNSRYSRQ
jgi:predicted ATP-dependent protease